MNKLFRTVLLLFVFSCFGLNLKAAVFYVNQATGNDSYDGTSPTFISGSTGPKKSLSSCISVAAHQDTINIAKGNYAESLTLDRSFLWNLTDTVTVKTLNMNFSGIELRLKGGIMYLKDSLLLNEGIISPLGGIRLVLREYGYTDKGNKNSFVNGFFFLENSNPFAGNMIFPVGNGSDHRPVRINIKQSTYDLNQYGFKLFSATAPAATLPPGFRSVSKVHHWEMHHYGKAVPQDIEMAATYDSVSTDDEVYDIDSLRLLFLPYGATVYQDLGGIGTTPRQGEISASSLADTTGYFALGNTAYGLNALGHPEPFARLNFNNACSGNNTAFSDVSVDHKYVITRRNWNFGTGNLADTSNLANPFFRYNTAGTYQVTLKVWNNKGFSDSIKLPVTIHERPQVAFNSPIACPGQPVTFNDQSTVAGGSIASRKWDFGDGTLGLSQVENHTFPAPGNYSVKLVAVSDKGCTDSASKTITMLQPANPRLYTPDACLGNNVVLNGSGGYPADTIVSWEYRLNGILVGNRKTLDLKDTLKSGTYTVLLSVLTNNNCVATARDTFRVFPKAGVTASATSVCVNNTAAFTGNGGSPGDTISSWTWRISGSVVSTQRNFNRTMFAAGTFPLRLSVVTQNGCVDSVNGNITVFGLPQPEFALDKNVAGNDSIQCFKANRFELKNLSTAGAGQSITSVKWFWDNGVIPSSNVQSFGSPGAKKAKLVVGTNKGCFDSTSKTYVVLDPIAVRWGSADVCHPDPVVLRDSSLLSGTTAAQRHWIFGDGSVQTTTAANVTHAYPNGGTFLVTLVLKTVDGCSDSFTKPLFLRTRPTLSIIPTGNLPFCPGDSLLLSANGGDSVRWFDGKTNRNRYFRSAGTYKVTAISGRVCSVTDSFRVWVFNAPSADAGPDTTMYAGGTLVLNGKGGSIYRWAPASLCSTPNNQATKVQPDRDTTFILRVTDGNGCIAFDSVRVKVLNSGNPAEPVLPNMITPNDDGMNDAWDLSALKDFGDWHIRVFSSTGKLIYEKETGYKNDWKGTNLDGKELDPGTYMYVLKHRYSGKTMKGYLFIQRQ
ncbi:MAG: PKD domain-containing protein [Bacteroidetes bacterium]|nr:PKD domain-containing protein [Bacteroidota bacterium]